MQQHTFQVPGSRTELYFDASFDLLRQLAPVDNSFIITDEHILQYHEQRLKPWKTITIPAGETSKNLEVLDDIVRQLIALGADRDALIIGIGGGVVTDITGFVAGIYKRGVRCGFLPASVLGMVDACLGGKNGLDIGEYKNMVGLIRQPDFILYHYDLLQTLPEAEWINGFAEIIKHACILDAEMFRELKQHSMGYFRRHKEALAALIERNALLKLKVVAEDESEMGIRKILNFGHTLGHAIEHTCALPHGHAVSIGMAFAARVSAMLTGFGNENDLVALLKQYHLPVFLNFNTDIALSNMEKDKKKAGDSIQYVLLEAIGAATVRPLSMLQIEDLLRKYMHGYNN